MKKVLLFLLLFGSGVLLTTQAKKKLAYPYGKFSIYRLSLTDKKGTKYSLKNPEKFLSPKALQRRSKQNLSVDSTDLPLSQKYIDQINKKGFMVVGGSKWNNTLLVRVAKGQDSTLLTRFPFVVSSRKVYTAPDSIDFNLPDKIAIDSAAMKNNDTHPYGRGAQQIEMLNGLKLHQAGFKGNGMLVAVIDGGYMNVNKIEYFKNTKIIGHRDFVYPYVADPYQKPDHGTMVLSDMGANVDKKFVGTAPEATFLLLRSEDGDSENPIEEDYWAQAVEYADSFGVDVINSSLGYTKFDNKADNHEYREQDGKTALNSRTASMIASKGMILVNSAGNEGGRSWKRTNFPADAYDILAVAALTQDSINAPFSSVGPSFDGRVKPDVAARGYKSTVIDGTGIITQANGTSFASPIMCGMVTCLWQALPEKTALQIMDLVRRSANRATFPDNIYGYGVPDFWKAYQMGKAER